MSKLVTCETVAAIVVHARRVTARPANYSGHLGPGPFALCGSLVNWDTRLPVSAVSCRSCKELAAKEQS